MGQCFVSHEALGAWEVALSPEKEATIQEELFLRNRDLRSNLLPVAEKWSRRVRKSHLVRSY